MKFAFLIGILIFSATWLIAQPGNPGGDPDIPITGGILYLLAAGLGYGFYEIRKKIRGR